MGCPLPILIDLFLRRGHRGLPPESPSPQGHRAPTQALLRAGQLSRPTPQLAGQTNGFAGFRAGTATQPAPGSKQEDTRVGSEVGLPPLLQEKQEPEGWGAQPLPLSGGTSGRSPDSGDNVRRPPGTGAAGGGGGASSVAVSCRIPRPRPRTHTHWGI